MNSKLDAGLVYTFSVTTQAVVSFSSVGIFYGVSCCTLAFGSPKSLYVYTAYRTRYASGVCFCALSILLVHELVNCPSKFVLVLTFVPLIDDSMPRLDRQFSRYSVHQPGTVVCSCGLFPWYGCCSNPKVIQECQRIGQMFS